jgi:NADH-quinone oxidoreductase subunit L
VVISATLGSLALSVWALLALLEGASHEIATKAVNWLSSVWALLALLEGASHEITTNAVNWLSIGSLNIDFGLRLTPLSAVMLLVVCVVSLMVQVYSRGYMHGDPGSRRYFAFIALFTFSMLGLVLADNLLLIFMCWELVGLCSYLLIGFWFERPAAASAAKKAFLITRIGDLGFLAAILVLYAATGTLDINQLHLLAAAGVIGGAALTWAAIGLFLGAMGKSAQFPLHIWLPDAMEGPTPVSALIHAATMVAAGVFLIARMFPLFEAAPHVLTGIAWLGALTAILAAGMGLVMHDIKRVLAYSTISQLGYMMLGLATGGIAVGIFHLFNHAFFKALLFLGAGSLSHATGTFDMRQMGGLRKAMPWTFYTFIIGSLSLAGVWPLSGFFSKEEILGSALDKQPLLFAVLLFTAFLTAFYMFRVVFLAFGGKYRGSAHPHESPAVMLVPMAVLAVLAVFSGWLNANGAFDSFLGHGVERGFLNGLIGILTHPLAWYSLGAAGAGILLAYAVYSAEWLSRERLARAFGPVYTLLVKKYWMDELVQDVIAGKLLLGGLFKGFERFDTKVIDGFVNGVARSGGSSGRLAQKVQSGQLQVYALAIITGLVVLALVMLLMR